MNMFGVGIALLLAVAVYFVQELGKHEKGKKGRVRKAALSALVLVAGLVANTLLSNSVKTESPHGPATSPSASDSTAHGDISSTPPDSIMGTRSQRKHDVVHRAQVSVAVAEAFLGFTPKLAHQYDDSIVFHEPSYGVRLILSVTNRSATTLGLLAGSARVMQEGRLLGAGPIPIRDDVANVGPYSMRRITCVAPFGVTGAALGDRLLGDRVGFIAPMDRVTVRVVVTLTFMDGTQRDEVAVLGPMRLNWAEIRN